MKYSGSVLKKERRLRVGSNQAHHDEDEARPGREREEDQLLEIKGCAHCRQTLSIKYGGRRISQRGPFLLLFFLFARPHFSYGFSTFFVMATHTDRRTTTRVPGAHARRGANVVRSLSASPTAGTVGIETAPPVATRDRNDHFTKGEKAGVIIGVVLFFAIMGTSALPAS